MKPYRSGSLINRVRFRYLAGFLLCLLPGGPFPPPPSLFRIACSLPLPGKSMVLDTPTLAGLRVTLTDVPVLARDTRDSGQVVLLLLD